MHEREAAGGTLIVGGGFAGGYVARLLGRAGATLVSRENFMLYTPILPEAASGTLEPRHVVVPLRAMCPDAELVLGRATALDEASRTVSVETDVGPLALRYTRLVIAFGAVTRVLPAGTALPDRSPPASTIVAETRSGAFAAVARNVTMFPGCKLLVLAAAILIAAVGPPTSAQERTVAVFAAASLKNALDEINAAFTKRTATKVVASYAATPALIKQIEQGAPADIFASADLDWMDYGAQKKLIKEDTRVNLLGNRLVLIASKDSKIENADIRPGFDLAQLAGNGRIVTGDVRAVPAGKYARAALEKLDAWAAVEPKIAMVENVRAALMLVARGEAALGIVYESDAKVEPAVKIVGRFPSGSHPEIVYPVALITNVKPEAAQYLAFLRSRDAKAVFEKYGFTFLPEPAS